MTALVRFVRRLTSISRQNTDGDVDMGDVREMACWNPFAKVANSIETSEIEKSSSIQQRHTFEITFGRLSVNMI